MPSYELLGSIPKNRINKKCQIFKRIIGKIPGKYKLFRDDILEQDSDHVINTKCVAFKKISSDL